MKFLYIIVLVVAAMSPGCFNSQTLAAQNAVILTATAQTANVMLDILIARYRAELFTTVDMAFKRGDTKEEAELRVDLVVEKWRPIWDAWEAFKMVHDEAARAIRKGPADESIKVMKQAYCELMSVWPIDLAEPVAPFDCGIVHSSV
jgi:hypothetical protein